MDKLTTPQDAVNTQVQSMVRQFSLMSLSFLGRHSATKGIIIAMICTFFDAFNVPVFWPILVMYFIMLFCITMKRQIKVTDQTFQHSPDISADTLHTGTLIRHTSALTELNIDLVLLVPSAGHYALLQRDNCCELSSGSFL